MFELDISGWVRYREPNIANDNIFRLGWKVLEKLTSSMTLFKMIFWIILLKKIFWIIFWKSSPRQWPCSRWLQRSRPHLAFPDLLLRCLPVQTSTQDGPCSHHPHCLSNHHFCRHSNRHCHLHYLIINLQNPLLCSSSSSLNIISVEVVEHNQKWASIIIGIKTLLAVPNCLECQNSHTPNFPFKPS